MRGIADNYLTPRARKLATFLLAILLCLAGPAFAETSFEITPEVDRLIRDGQKAMYNLDYALADQKFDELIRRFPSHPAGYMYRAEIFWWKALRDKKNKGLEEAFNRYTNEAIIKGEALLSQNPRDFYAHLYLASALGNRTRFHVMVSRSYLGAMRSGLRGNDHNKAALALRPDYVDCLIGTGSYNYFAGSLPAVIKPFAWMFGARGDRTKGLQQLEEASHKGEFGQTEAKTVLLGVYFNEKRFEDYRKLLVSLIEQFPANHVFYLWLADESMGQHQTKEGIQFFAALLERAGKRNSGFRISKAYAYQEKGRLELASGSLDDAAASFSQAIETANQDTSLLASVHLLRGFALDLKGKRDAALADYQTVLNLPNFDDTHKNAQRFLKNPFRGSL